MEEFNTKTTLELIETELINYEKWDLFKMSPEDRNKLNSFYDIFDIVSGIDELSELTNEDDFIKLMNKHYPSRNIVFTIKQ